MPSLAAARLASVGPRWLASRYRRVRSLTDQLAEPLSPEDCCVQSQTDSSPAKWHLAHTTWFFERFVLSEYEAGFSPHDERYNFLFNSYYVRAGDRQPRPKRGMITRPSLGEVLAYRASVDERMGALLGGEPSAEALELIEIGLHHEQQHQELLVADIKHLLSCNPFGEAYASWTRSDDGLVAGEARPGGGVPAMSFVECEGGSRWIGADASRTFCYDNERGRHEVLVLPFAIADRPLCNAEVLAFVEGGGYERPELWLDDGWAWVVGHGVSAPMYWRASEAGWSCFTLEGWRTVDAGRPACHLSYYEADAIARFLGARLPTEVEWEVACVRRGERGRLLDQDDVFRKGLEPSVSPSPHEGWLAQMMGDVWEWTSSAYGPYPGFRAPEGALGEYNGKFMVNQMVCRGGSFATPADHIRPTYRNFFHPEKRWAFTGVRLAKDV
ncbi:MAG: ergothioneine biosynthesis protein EgtB [Planctomycetota bacterium]